jgi:hypothetical protein
VRVAAPAAEAFAMGSAGGSQANAEPTGKPEPDRSGGRLLHDTLHGGGADAQRGTDLEDAHAITT